MLELLGYISAVSRCISAVSRLYLGEQVEGLVRVRHERVSLRALGYSTIGLDDGWQDCSSGNGYHDNVTGVPKVNAKFPDMRAMTAAAAAGDGKGQCEDGGRLLQQRANTARGKFASQRSFGVFARAVHANVF